MTTLEVIIDTLTSAGVDRAYPLGEVPPSPQYPYAVVSHAPGAPQVRTLNYAGPPMGRFTVQHFGKSAESIDMSEGISGLTFAAFDGRPLDLPGTPVAWQEVATTPYRDPDDQGVLNVLHTYRF